MPANSGTVVQHIAAPTEAQFHAALIAGLARIAAEQGRGTLADKSGRTTRGLDKLFEGSNPCGKGLLDFLLADATALDEVLALYGLSVAPRRAKPSTDLALCVQLGRTLAEYLSRLSDGKRCHNDTLAMAVLFRPLIPQLAAIVDEADRLRGVAA